MSTAATTDEVMRAVPTAPIYASFGLDEEEYAVDVRHLREVVNLPSALTTMPLAPDFVAGVFNLRGAIIPVLHTKRLLRASGPVPANAKVVVIDHGGAQLGMIIDDTGRVFRPRGDEQILFEFEDSSTHRVVAGVLKIGASLVRVLDLARLMALENVPYPRDDFRSKHVARARALRKRCITFNVGGMQLGFAIDGIHQIVLAAGIEPSPIQESLCVGVMHIRGEIVPVVQFASLLQVDAGPIASAAEARVIVLEVSGAHVGLLVDDVVSIDSYSEEDLMRVPVLTQYKGSLFAGCLDYGARGLVFLLNSQGVLDNDEINRITGNHSQLFKTKVPAARLAHRGADQRQSVLWFKAREAFALPMGDVREIIDGNTSLIAMPGAPAFVAGMINVRGQLVPVVDVRAFYQLGQETVEMRTDRKIVVLDHADLLLGLLVDTVESIVHIDPADRISVPTLLRNAMPPPVRQDVREIIRAVGEEERPLHILVLDAARIVAALSAREPDAAYA